MAKTPKPTPRKSAKKAAAPKAVQGAAAKGEKKGTNIESLKAADKGYQLAKSDAVKYLDSRRQAMFSISRHYHLEVGELAQEGYEILLTCLRDFNPIFEKADGTQITVQFNTFFGNRMETKAMELRNRDPEYQARQAYTADLNDEERERFRQEPPLLVQHLDKETVMQEALNNEVSIAQGEVSGDINLKIARDSFFERKLNELVAREKDDKRRAALMHVKVGGVYNFQEMAFHFGVTDSRASQILNDLMDAFYVQRIIDGSLESVRYDFQKLKFNDKRAIRLLEEALKHCDTERQAKISAMFAGDYSELPKLMNAVADAQLIASEAQKVTKSTTVQTFVDVMTAEENAKFPLMEIGMQPLTALQFLDINFRPPVGDAEQPHITAIMEDDPQKFPLIVTEKGWIIDGERRVQAALRRGMDSYMCMTRQVTKELDVKRLRVAINARTAALDKTEMYFAISALSDLGLSQQRIADALGTSRTNVIVYAKVKDRGTAKLQALFEDGFIQITNASACVDLSEDMQDRVTSFIRTHGVGWSKGSQFNDLHEAAVNNKLDKLEQKVASKSSVSGLSPTRVHHAPVPALSSAGQSVPSGTADQSVVNSLKKRLETYEQALKDADIWTAQRESVISRQTQELQSAQAEVEKLQKELDALELSQFGNADVVKEALREQKLFYSVAERLAGALDAVAKATKSIRSLDLQRKHLAEVEEFVEQLEQKTNQLRVEVINKGPKRTMPNSKKRSS